MTQPFHVCTTLKSKFSRRNLPNGRLRLKIKRRKKPATVGGRTSGIVRIPSRTALEPGLSFMIFLAQKIPRKNAIVVATTPVLRDIHRGLQFISCKNSIIVLFPLLLLLLLLLQRHLLFLLLCMERIRTLRIL